MSLFYFVLGKMHGMKNKVENHLMDMLRQGLQQLGEDPDAHPCSDYLAFIDLLFEWNRAYNLTGLRTREQMLPRHILDSLAVLPLIQGHACLDVGTGAGLPGLPLALARPAQHWTLLDSNSKKIRFLNQVVLQLHPGNVELVHSRMQEYRPPRRFDTIIARAYTSLKELHERAAGWLQDNGRLIAMKGRKPVRELAQLAEYRIGFEVVEIHVPVLDVTRHIIIMHAGKQSSGR
jgi:16S rRNA (guanine527-N7)-methyltransferase